MPAGAGWARRIDLLDATLLCETLRVGGASPVEKRERPPGHEFLPKERMERLFLVRSLFPHGRSKYF
jgi:hypothetical protein